jgi:hypothetical protein
MGRFETFRDMQCILCVDPIKVTTTIAKKTVVALTMEEKERWKGGTNELPLV